ncbi:4Fe-4S ferredoxin [Anaerosporomusa subterranea]|uniref:4Fe-4S ferredoxin n=1 Tax=Anaerosporomusa subterranea TaxID=1794912 RepID=A0A154BTE2_ANASB|nr:4Fe-4S dicluster domain-containing protein [Anaerosporomusa subterranea]KYZ76788.1 4Fe-4S ferredoxin [Anaerosporomusa subterranea]
MRIDKDKCAGCGQCIEFCTLGNISSRRRNPKNSKLYYEIDEDDCVDCGVCLRAAVCSADALFMPNYEWPRTIRSAFSDPTVEHRETKVAGRGTEEIKTNEITGRIKRGFVGISCEMGRPSVGARFSDIEKVATALASLGVEFESNNPCTRLMADPKTGIFKDEVKNETVLSAIIEMLVPLEKMAEVLETIRGIASQVDCVFSVDLITVLDEDNSIPTLPILRSLNWPVLPNGKMNTGLGRPLAKEV